MTVRELEDRLRAALARPLPGPAAQQRMAPRPRPGWQPAAGPPGRKPAAVLLLAYPGESGASIVLTTRSDRLAQQSGQVSLPGGAVFEGESPIEAAVREAHEEAGIDPTMVRIVGALTPLDIPISGFLLHPVVGVADRRPAFSARDGEVARILEVRVADLLDPASLGFDERLRDGVHYDIPFFDVGGEAVWGATAMVLAEFLSLLGWRPAARRA